MSKSKLYETKLYLLSPNKERGFTLIELLVVVIILGILSAIALPNFLAQVGKAKEVEFQNTVGTINRAQQAYHFEKQSFAQGANDDESLQKLNVSLAPKYIDSFNIVNNGNSATVSPVNNEFAIDGTRAFSGAIFYNAGSYQSTICRSQQSIPQINPSIAFNDCETNVSLK